MAPSLLKKYNFFFYGSEFKRFWSNFYRIGSYAGGRILSWSRSQSQKLEPDTELESEPESDARAGY